MRRPRLLAGWFHTYIYAPVAYGLTGLVFLSLIALLVVLLLAMFWLMCGRFAGCLRAARARSPSSPPPALVRARPCLPPYLVVLAHCAGTRKHKRAKRAFGSMVGTRVLWAGQNRA